MLPTPEYSEEKYLMLFLKCHRIYVDEYSIVTLNRTGIRNYDLLKISSNDFDQILLKGNPRHQEEVLVAIYSKRFMSYR